MKFRPLAHILRKQPAFWIASALLVGLAGWWGVRSCQRKPDPQRWTFIPGFGIRLPMRYALHGIDVSRHNSRIDWPRVAEMQANGLKISFVFIKATEGATRTDPQFSRNWREAGRLGLRRGAYHFYHPTRDPIKQANNFMKQVRLEKGDFVPVLDFEVLNGVPDDDILDGLHRWLDAVEDQYGMKPIIYTNGYLYRRFIKNHLADYPLWVADYSTSHPGLYRSDNLFIWQHNQSGRVDGIRGLVDFNVLVPDSARLNEICL